MSGSEGKRPIVGLLDYPFPLDRGYLAHLRLPADGLTTQDAERLHEAIDSLVTDPDVASAPRGRP